MSKPESLSLLAMTPRTFSKFLPPPPLQDPPRPSIGLSTAKKFMSPRNSDRPPSISGRGQITPSMTPRTFAYQFPPPPDSGKSNQQHKNFSFSKATANQVPRKAVEQAYATGTLPNVLHHVHSHSHLISIPDDQLKTAMESVSGDIAARSNIVSKLRGEVYTFFDSNFMLDIPIETFVVTTIGAIEN